MNSAIKVALLTMFEPGGGREGELTRFREGLHLRPWKVSGTERGASWRNEEGVAALIAGVGPVNTAVNVLSWAFQAGVDWRKTFWLVCGIAGGNPAKCSLGSPVWAEWVVDGDLAHDIHPQDAPKGWTTGILPLGASRPFGRAEVDSGLYGRPTQVFHLNGQLANWAWKVSRHVRLSDPASSSNARKTYRSFACGTAKPAVVRGAVLSAARFWHGAAHHAWAERWVRHWTRGRGHFAVASMEDSGTLGALRQLHQLGLADWRRILVLRSVSNYTLPATAGPATRINLAGLSAALENSWRVGRAVIAALLDHASEASGNSSRMGFPLPKHERSM